MRKESQRLRACPVCGTTVSEDLQKKLGLRYFGDQDYLPGNIGAMDFDRVLERKGQLLILELKPQGAPISKGARMTFRTMTKLGAAVWVVWQTSDKLVEVGQMDRRGEIKEVKTLTVKQLFNRIAKWLKWADTHPRHFYAGDGPPRTLL